jgi:trigger factor
MNVTVEQLPNCLATLKIEVEPAKVSAARDSIIGEYTKLAKLPGFRPGKAPRQAIERRYKKEIKEELERKLLGESTRSAIAEKKLRVLQVANVEDVEFADDKGLSFTATVVTHPEFQLPEYKGLPVTVPSVEVTDADVDQSLEELRDQNADFVDVEGRAAEMDDYVVVDYKGAIEGKPVHEVFPKAGKPLSSNEDFWIRMTPEAFFPGYAAALVGMKVGDTRKFDIIVPVDFPVPDMPGQTIAYEVTLKAIKRKEMPALDDAFANSVVAGKSVDDLRTMAREEITQQKKNQAEAVKRREIMRQLLSHVECELPVNLVRNETQRILREIVKENHDRGVADEVLQQNEKELVGTAANNARERIKGTFVLLRIAEKEGIKVTREELFGRVAALAERYEMTYEKMLKELQKRDALEQIGEEILTAKVLDFLASAASVSTAPAGA